MFTLDFAEKTYTSLQARSYGPFLGRPPSPLNATSVRMGAVGRLVRVSFRHVNSWGLRD